LTTGETRCEAILGRYPSVKGRILLVDDNVDFLDSTKDVVEDEGFEVVTATSGEEAIRLVRWQDFDLVLMDIKMQGMHGVESFIEMKKLDPDIKVIMCTAYIVENLIREALEEGALAVLNKPFEMRLLLKTIADALSSGGLGRILLADGDRENCSRIGEALTRRGHKVTVAYDGQDAVSKAAETDFDVLVLDVKLPVFDGMQVYHRVKTVQPNVFAAVITGFPDELDPATRQLLKNESGLVSMTKPLDPGRLLDFLETIFAAKSLDSKSESGG
jgi:two-component system, NtrC family, response regulator HydG